MLSCIGRRKNKIAFSFDPDVAFSYIDQNLVSMDHFYQCLYRILLCNRSIRVLQVHRRKKKVENIHSTSTCKGFKRDRSLSLAQVCEDSTPKHETIMEKSRVCDKKTLKIHLKVGVGEVPKRNSAGYGHKKCNMQDYPNVTKRRKVGWANGVTNDVVGVQKESTELDNLKQLVKKATPSSSNDVVNAQGLQSPVGKDYSLAEKTLKEAIDLKHSGGRLKNGESEVEVSGIYLRAALKFLLAASMFKVRDMGSIALGERTQSTKIYIDTPKILKQCAISFESTGEIAAAALAYKCMEVAYMRVIFSMSSHIRRDSRELQASLHGHPFGKESSPSSAIDATNIHEDGALPGSKAKGVEPLASKATCCSMHLLNYVEYVRSAIDATQRSLSALKAAHLKYGVLGIAAVKTALDFHFHDMDGFIRLVQLALEDIDI